MSDAQTHFIGIHTPAFKALHEYRITKWA